MVKLKSNIKHKTGNWFEIVNKLQFTLKKKNTENFIRKCARAATVYHICCERNKRHFGKEINSMEFVIQIIMEDITIKLFGLKLGYLGLNIEICKNGR